MPVVKALDELNTKSGEYKNPSYEETYAYLENVAQKTATNPTISLSSKQPGTGEVYIKAVYGEICVVHVWVNTELKTCLITLGWKEDCDESEDDWHTYWRYKVLQQRCQWTPTEKEQNERPVLSLVHQLKQAFLALDPSQKEDFTTAAENLVRKAAEDGLPIDKKALKWSNTTLHQKKSMSLADIKDGIPSMDDDATLQKSTYSTSFFVRYTVPGCNHVEYLLFERISNASGKLELSVYVESF